MAPKRRWCTLTGASTAMVPHWLLLPVMRRNDNNDWPVHSLMLSLHDLQSSSATNDEYHLLFTEAWFWQCIVTVDMAEPWYRETLHGWQVKFLMSCEDTNLAPYVFVRFMLFVWYAKHPPAAFCFSKSWILRLIEEKYSINSRQWSCFVTDLSSDRRLVLWQQLSVEVGRRVKGLGWTAPESPIHAVGWLRHRVRQTVLEDWRQKENYK